MLIELHLLQSFPVSNLNRDELGQPKTAQFGGHARARISSQSLKRAARELLPHHGLELSETGVRTKRLRDAASALLVRPGREEDETKDVAQAGLERLGFGVDARGLTQYLLFVGRPATEALADYCDRNYDLLVKAAAAKKTAAAKAAKKDPDQDNNTRSPARPAKAAKAKPDKATHEEARRILDATRAADVALFGRMIADNKDFSVDAASQVAHALSTHAVVTDFDYFTAVDDLRPGDEPGADMIGTIDFNAACYYRYANLDLAQLATNLAGDADLVTRSAQAWLHAFIRAVPGGKQNSTAARTLPQTLLGVVRDDGAWNLANAYLRPVPSNGDLMTTSSERLVQHFQQLGAFYGTSALRRTVFAAIDGHLPGVPDEHKASTVEDFVARLISATTK
ncbi:type I-E CRISPR-associated protein Cas7/Cse4/CasC [Streptomyces sp. NPDC021020]|uniref:type I-E CRISPR-associated protein Cas7/Cse4/CasC n=1 Tax=Streptomyces sp. NPDC021020 TaxID=3365109 RepID=UPI00378EE714